MFVIILNFDIKFNEIEDPNFITVRVKIIVTKIFSKRFDKITFKKGN